MKRIALGVVLATGLALLWIAAPSEIGAAVGFEVGKWVLKKTFLKH
jgi:hypothetical protein